MGGLVDNKSIVGKRKGSLLFFGFSVNKQDTTQIRLKLLIKTYLSTWNITTVVIISACLLLLKVKLN